MKASVDQLIDSLELVKLLDMPDGDTAKLAADLLHRLRYWRREELRRRRNSLPVEHWETDG